MAQSVLSEGPTLIQLDHLPPAVVVLLQQGLPDGHTLDLSGYVTEADLTAALVSAYVKPAGGIPASDLATAYVQGGQGITAIVKLTQATYDALTVKSASTLYVIEG